MTSPSLTTKGYPTRMEYPMYSNPPTKLTFYIPKLVTGTKAATFKFGTRSPKTEISDAQSMMIHIQKELRDPHKNNTKLIKFYSNIHTVDVLKAIDQYLYPPEDNMKQQLINKQLYKEQLVVFKAHALQYQEKKDAETVDQLDIMMDNDDDSNDDQYNNIYTPRNVPKRIKRSYGTRSISRNQKITNNMLDQFEIAKDSQILFKQNRDSIHIKLHRNPQDIHPIKCVILELEDGTCMILKDQTETENMLNIMMKNQYEMLSRPDHTSDLQIIKKRLSNINRMNKTIGHNKRKKKPYNELSAHYKRLRKQQVIQIMVDNVGVNSSDIAEIFGIIINKFDAELGEEILLINSVQNAQTNYQKVVDRDNKMSPSNVYFQAYILCKNLTSTQQNNNEKILREKDVSYSYDINTNSTTSHLNTNQSVSHIIKMDKYKWTTAELYMSGLNQYRPNKKIWATKKHGRVSYCCFYDPNKTFILRLYILIPLNTDNMTLLSLFLIITISIIWSYGHIVNKICMIHRFLFLTKFIYHVLYCLMNIKTINI